jgi:hypothetical protein
LYYGSKGFGEYATEMASCGWIYIYIYIYTPSFMQIGTGIVGILRFCCSNLKGSNVGITDGRDL